MNYKQRKVQKTLKDMWKIGFIAEKWVHNVTGRTVAYRVRKGDGEEKLVSYSNLKKNIRNLYI